MKMTEQQKIAAKLGLFDPVAELLKDESEKIASVIESLPASLDHTRRQSSQEKTSSAVGGSPKGLMERGDEVDPEWLAHAGKALEEHIAAGGDPNEFVQQYVKQNAPIGRNALIGGVEGGLIGGGGALLGHGLGRLLMGGRGSPGLGFPLALGAGSAVGGAIGMPMGQRSINKQLAESALAQYQGQQGQGMDPTMGQGMEQAKEGAAKVAQPPMGAPGPAAGNGAPQMMQGQMAQPGSPEMQAQQAMMDAEAMKADPLEAQNETLRKVIQNQKLKLELAELTDKVTQAAQPPQMPQVGPEEGPEAGGDGQAMSDPMEYMRQALSE